MHSLTGLGTQNSLNPIRPEQRWVRAEASALVSQSPRTSEGSYRTGCPADIRCDSVSDSCTIK